MTVPLIHGDLWAVFEDLLREFGKIRRPVAEFCAMRANFKRMGN
jgi:hypothetical protein